MDKKKKTTTTKKPRTRKKKVEPTPEVVVYRYQVIHSSGVIVETNDPVGFCRSKRLNHQLLYATLRGARTDHRGWRLEEKNG